MKYSVVLTGLILVRITAKSYSRTNLEKTLTLLRNYKLQGCGTLGMYTVNSSFLSPSSSPIIFMISSNASAVLLIDFMIKLLASVHSVILAFKLSILSVVCCNMSIMSRNVSSVLVSIMKNSMKWLLKQMSKFIPTSQDQGV